MSRFGSTGASGGGWLGRNSGADTGAGMDEAMFEDDLDGGSVAQTTESVVLEEELPDNYEPTQEEILEYAKWLGMDLEDDKDLFWIAREGLKAPLPENWKPCKTAEDEVPPTPPPSLLFFSPLHHHVVAHFDKSRGCPLHNLLSHKLGVNLHNLLSHKRETGTLNPKP